MTEACSYKGSFNIPTTASRTYSTQCHCASLLSPNSQVPPLLCVTIAQHTSIIVTSHSQQMLPIAPRSTVTQDKRNKNGRSTPQAPNKNRVQSTKRVRKPLCPKGSSFRAALLVVQHELLSPRRRGMGLMAQFHLLTAGLPALGINRLSGFPDQNKHLITGNYPRS